MKILQKLGSSLVAGLLFSAAGCGGGSSNSDQAVANPDAFVASVQAVAVAAPEDSEPLAVDALALTTPEDSEPVSI